jgi:hypothetical protein
MISVAGRSHRRKRCDVCALRQRNGWRGPADLVHGQCGFTRNAEGVFVAGPEGGCGAPLTGRSNQVRCHRCAGKIRSRRYRAAHKHLA